MSQSTCNGVLRTLKIILNDAVQDDIISKSPASGIKALKEIEKATETYHRALTEQEQKDFMQEMQTDYYYEFVALLLCTGMRLGEQRKKLGNLLPMNDSRVFVSVYGSIVHNHAINRAISNALRRLEQQGKLIEHFTAHVLQNTKQKEMDNLKIVL